MASTEDGTESLFPPSDVHRFREDTFSSPALQVASPHAAIQPRRPVSRPKVGSAGTCWCCRQLQNACGPLRQMGRSDDVVAHLKRLGWQDDVINKPVREGGFGGTSTNLCSLCQPGAIPSQDHLNRISDRQERLRRPKITKRMRMDNAASPLAVQPVTTQPPATQPPAIQPSAIQPLAILPPATQAHHSMTTTAPMSSTQPSSPLLNAFCSQLDRQSSDSSQSSVSLSVLSDAQSLIHSAQPAPQLPTAVQPPAPQLLSSPEAVHTARHQVSYQSPYAGQKLNLSNLRAEQVGIVAEVPQSWISNHTKSLYELAPQYRNVPDESMTLDIRGEGVDVHANVVWAALLQNWDDAGQYLQPIARRLKVNDKVA